jgi:hypothetical protein|nr:MAG TPA: hypothetical protein [Caudoviricetes sp.]
MKLKTNNTALHGSRLTVPVDGTIQIDRNGEINVSEACAAQLLTLPDWIVVSKEAPKNEAPAPEVADPDAEVIAAIRSMSMEEMLAAAAEAGYPAEEYSKYKKNSKLMAAYLVKKYKAASEAAKDEDE